jgi:hypothetical protein
MQAELPKNIQTNQKKSKVGRGGARPGAGRPKGSFSEARQAQLRAEATLRELAAQHTPEAVRTLVEIMQDEATPAAARVSAIRELLDRAHGKPTVTVAGDEERPIPLAIVTGVPDYLDADNDSD